jgi:hypothetical protein
MLRANQAVRIGLRAATRNPELAFAKALVDLAGTALALLPAMVAAYAVFAVATGADPLLDAVRGLQVLRSVRWGLVSALASAALLSWLLAVVFWSGALPVLAADAELSRRPPSGTFFLLAGRGFSRVAAASAGASGIAIFVRLAVVAALAAGALACLRRPSAGLFAALALLLSAAVLAGFLVDLLGNLWLVRAAALGDGATPAFARAASLLARRLGACAVVALAFALLELICGLVVGLFAALASGAFGGNPFEPNAQLLSVPARISVSIAFAAVFAWLEVGQKGAFAALAADDDGLIEGSPPEQEPRPAPPRAEPIVEALPVPEEEVIEALPVDDEKDPPAEDE